MGQQHPTHLWIFVLALINNGLKKGEGERWQKVKMIVVYIFFSGVLREEKKSNYDAGGK